MYLFTIVLVIVLVFLPPATLAYKAAVLEYHPIIADTPKNTILWNLHEYRNFALKAKQQNVDIIVFPEYGLSGLVNNTKLYAVEVYDFSDVIIYLKAIAAEYQIYMVVNILEKAHKYCCDVPKYYSTTIVFDRTGSMVARYRKINLFNEAELTPGDWNQDSLFDTDFNITFGILVSHDIFFKYPSKHVVDRGVKDVVYPSAWSSTAPFYFSLSIQHGYSLSNGVTLLVSGFNQPWKGFSGSGIYLHDGRVIEAFYTDSAKSKLIVQEIPTRMKQKNECSTDKNENIFQEIDIKHVLQKDFYPSIYKIQDINLTEKNISEQICDGEFCCTFHIITNTNTSSFYKLAAYNGYIAYNRPPRSLHVQTCSLLSCENDSVDSCATRLNTSTKFARISVWGNFTNKDMFYLPLALNFDLQPLNRVTYCQYNSTDSLSVELTSTIQENVFAFGILGQMNCASAFQMDQMFLFAMVYLGTF